MVEVKNKLSSHWWWFDNHSKVVSPRRSAWLQSTISELDEKTVAMLKLIEEDADSFAKRAEMYYKKRPELINLVGDFYKSYRLLAERCDQAKFDSGTTKLLAPWMASSLSISKGQTEKSICSVEKSYDTYSENYDLEESAESEIENPESESEFGEMVDEEEEEVSSGVVNDEVMKLREEIYRLKEESRVQKEQLMQKDEEKREAIRQLSFAVDLHKEENLQLRRKITNNSAKKQIPMEFNKLKGVFGKLFNGSSIAKASAIPLIDPTS